MLASRLPYHDAYCEVFLKTLGFYCTLLDRGCTFLSSDLDSSDMLVQENVLVGDAIVECGHNRRKSRRCLGHPILRYDDFNQPYIE